MNRVTVHATFPETATELLERSATMLLVPLPTDDMTGLATDLMQLVQGAKLVAHNLHALQRVMNGLGVQDAQLARLVEMADEAAARADRVAVVIGRGEPVAWGLPAVPAGVMQ